MKMLPAEPSPQAEAASIDEAASQAVVEDEVT